jgi:hypothetical protein
VGKGVGVMTAQELIDGVWSAALWAYGCGVMVGLLFKVVNRS